MATPNKLKRLIGDKTTYRWLSEQLEIHHTIAKVAEKNGITTAAIYRAMEINGIIVVQKPMKKLPIIDA